jgi:hypothetical protein
LRGSLLTSSTEADRLECPMVIDYTAVVGGAVNPFVSLETVIILRCLPIGPSYTELFEAEFLDCPDGDVYRNYDAAALSVGSFMHMGLQRLGMYLRL